MAATVFEHKRGDSFAISGQLLVGEGGAPVDLTGVAVRAQLRDGDALGNLAVKASRQYFIPFVVPRPVTLTGLRINVTTALAGTASVGIYSNTQVSGDDAPGSLLASNTDLNTDTTGDNTGSLSLTLAPGTIYWASFIGSAAATLRSVPLVALQTSLGRIVNANSANSHLFADGSGSTLPATAPTSLSTGYGHVPAIYLIE